MKRFSRYFFPALSVMMMVALATLPSLARRTTSSWDLDARQRKADYIFIEGFNRLMTDSNYTSLHEFISRAREVNPGDDEISTEYYILHLPLATDTAEVGSIMDALRRRFDASPADKTFAKRYLSALSYFGNYEEMLRVSRILHGLYPDNIDFTGYYLNLLTSIHGTDSLAREIELLDSTEIVRGLNPNIFRMKLQLLENSPDRMAAINAARERQQRVPQSDIYNILLGESYANRQMNDSALVYINRAIAIDSLNTYARYSRALIFQEQGDSTAYENEMRSLLTFAEIDPEMRLELMRMYVSDAVADTTKREATQNTFDAVLDIAPHDVMLRKLYASYLQIENKPAASAEQLDIAVGLEPDDIQSWLWLISLYSEIKEFDKSNSAIARASYYFPRDHRLPMMRASNLLMCDSVQAALATVDTLIARSDTLGVDDRALLYGFRGDILTRAGETDSAIEAYDKALRLVPSDYEIMNNYAYLLACAGRDLDHALEMIKTAVDKIPSPSATWLDTYAWVEFKRKNYTEAKNLIDRALDSTPSDEPLSAEVLEHAGDIYFFDGDHQKALEFWQQALEIDPDNDLLRRKVSAKTYFYE